MRFQRRKTAAFFVFLFLPFLARAADEATTDKALQWISNHLRESTAESDRDHAALTDAEAAITRAQSAVSLSRQYQDAAAGAVAAQALDTAQRAKALAELNLAHHDEASRRLEAALRSAGAGHSGGVAVRLSGKVLMKHAGEVGGSSWDGSGLVSPGDTLTLGPDAQAELAVIDGGWVSLGPNSSFTLTAPDPSFWSCDLAGKIHYIRDHGADVLKPVKYKTASVAVAVRGTEFELNSVDGHPDELIPIDGKMTLASTSAAKSQVSPTWWPLLKDTWKPPAPGTMTRLRMARGAIKPSANQIATGSDSVALLDIAGHYRVALDSNSVLEWIVNKNTGQPLYALRAGRAHVWGNGGTGPSFLTPNTVTTPAAREFDVTLTDGGWARFVIVDGTLEIAAVRQRADLSKIDSWWNN